MRKILLWDIAAVLFVAAVPAHAAPVEDIDANILLTDDQQGLERHAATLIKSDVVVKQIEQSIAFLKANHGHLSIADLPDIERYVHDLAYCIALVVANSDPSRPKILYNGFPGAEYGLVNPDNIYRFMPVSSSHRYRIAGRLNGSAHVSFQLTDMKPFTGGHLGQQFGIISSENLNTAPDGSFTMDFGPEPGEGRSNYLQLLEGADQLMIRDTMADWSKAPMTLQIERVDGPRLSTPDDRALAETVAAGLEKSVRLWIEIPAKHNFNVPVNTLPLPRATGAGGLQGQSNTGGHFSLEGDKALVVTVRKGTARYLGFQLGSNLYVPFDYGLHSSSLSNDQAIANPDGSYTYVVSLRDPGVANWLDPVGHPTGLMLIRWQGLDQPLAPTDAPVVRLVSMAQLERVLPPGTPRISEKARSKLLTLRQREAEWRRSASELTQVLEHESTSNSSKCNAEQERCMTPDVR